jgi:TRAP-type mannitol/chloroaromatic compound transport system substrate-binding protein
LGVFIKLDKESLKELPEEVRLFLSKALNAAGCKLLKQSVAQEGGV